MACWCFVFFLRPDFPTPYRNLAIAAFNKQKDKKAALELFEKAFRLDATDARVLMELDQLYKRLNTPPATRLEFLSEYASLVEKRDDLFLEMIALENFLGNYKHAYERLIKRKFHPWEGGEGKVSGQFVFCLIEIAKAALVSGLYQGAID